MTRSAALVLVLLFTQTHATPARQANRLEIQNLVRSFTAEMSRSGNPASYLSPKVTGQKRAKEIAEAKKHYTRFQITGFRVDRDLDFQDANHASLPVWVHTSTASIDLQQDATIDFERVDGHWYFQNFDFLVFPQGLVQAIMLIALIYTAIALGFFFHWRRHMSGSIRHRMIWDVLLITPVGWILYPKRKPWLTGQPAATEVPAPQRNARDRIADYFLFASYSAGLLLFALMFLWPGLMMNHLWSPLAIFLVAFSIILARWYSHKRSNHNRRRQS